MSDDDLIIVASDGTVYGPSVFAAAWELHKTHRDMHAKIDECFRGGAVICNDGQAYRQLRQLTVDAARQVARNISRETSLTPSEAEAAVFRIVGITGGDVYRGLADHAYTTASSVSQLGDAVAHATQACVELKAATDAIIAGRCPDPFPRPPGWQHAIAAGVADPWGGGAVDPKDTRKDRRAKQAKGQLARATIVQGDTADISNRLRALREARKARKR